MTYTSELLTQMVRTALGRSGVSTEPSMPPLRADVPLASDAGTHPNSRAPDDSSGSEADPGIMCVLAEKILGAWLRNRYQLLFPFSLDLRKLDPRQANLFLQAMIAAAQADGAFDGKEHSRIEGTLGLIDPDERETAFFEQALRQPKPLNEILRDVRDVESSALVYAASLMAVDQRKPVNRYYLKYLAARLQLPEELTGSLEQRYRSSS